MSLAINITGLDAVSKRLSSLPGVTAKKLSKELNSFGNSVVSEAKILCPVNEGYLRSSIMFEAETGSEIIGVQISANAEYAAYVEFGTKAFAAAYVATLPATWQQYAESFRGKTGGSFKDLLEKIMTWVRLKGIVATYSVKTHNRLKNSATTGRENDAAYPIAIKIIKEGVKPQPFMVPAFEKCKIVLFENLGIMGRSPLS